MPTYCWSCRDGHVTEEFHQTSEDLPEKIMCSTCAKAAKRAMSKETPTSSSSFRSYYDVGLGAEVHSSAEADKIAKSAGLVAVRHVGGALPR